MYKKIICILFLPLIIFTASCSSEIPEFQMNGTKGGVELLHLFDDYEALGLFWDNVDGEGFNVRLADAVNRNKDDFVTFSLLNKDIINLKSTESKDLILQDMLKDLRTVLIHLQDDGKMHYDNRDLDPFYTQSPGQYLKNFYGFLDTMSDTEIPEGENTISDTAIQTARTFLDYVLEEKSNDEIRDFMEDVTGLIKDLDQDDFTDLSETLGKALIRTSSPMWWDGTAFTDGSSGTNTGLGNLTKGVHALLTGMSSYVGKPGADETEEQIESRVQVRNAFYDIVREFNSLLSPENADVFKSLICNLEKFFTENGSVYGTRRTSNFGNAQDSYTSQIYNTVNDQLYSDAELRKTLKETLVGQLGLLVREDRDGSLIKNPSSKRYVMDRFIEDINRLGIDWDKANLEESLYDLVRFDCFGRDRRIVEPGNEAKNAYSASLIESFLFLGAITTNFGWDRLENANEVDNDDEYDVVARENGHGAFTGVMSMNDSLYSIGSKQTLGAGTYELVFFNEKEHNCYRSRKAFSRGAGLNGYRFDFTVNYPALAFASGAVAGEFGLKSGGNPNGVNPGEDNYVPYSANGTHEPGLAGFTMSWAMRACWEGEGPYYYADPDVETEEIDGKAYYKYLRPNGKIYAYVSKDSADPDNADKWDYFYPADEEDTEEENVEYSFRIDPTHAVFYSDVVPNQYYAVSDPKIRIRMGNAVNVEVKFSSETTYDRDKVMNRINDAIRPVVGKNVCSASGNYIKIVSDWGPITMNNIAAGAYKNPIKHLLKSDAKEDGDLRIESNAFTVNDDYQVSVSIDDVVDSQIVSIPRSSPDADGLWTYDELRTRLSQIGSAYVQQAGSGFIISGASNIKGVAKVEIKNVTGNAVADIFSSSGEKILVNRIQRFNRYKSSWKTDYFLIESAAGDKFYSPEDMSGNAASGGCFYYDEIIQEKDPVRACKSQEEAIFRNYQWVMTEKKMVLTIPMHINGVAICPMPGVTDIESAVYQVVEGNGFTGLVSSRKFRGNGVWAKGNHSGAVSDIPGDYRMRLLAESIVGLVKVDAHKIYHDTLASGCANPSVAGYNLPPLYRFAFPRQDAFRELSSPDNSYTFQQCQMGSREFTVGDKNWKERNTLFPIVAALFGRLRQESTPENHSLVRMLNGLLSIIKPWMFFNKDISDVCKGGWLPRIKGDKTSSTRQSSGALHAKFLMPDFRVDGFISDGSDKTAWFGGWDTRNYFQPQDKATLASVLFDTDPDVNRSDPSKRADGMVALLSEYDVTKERSESNKPRTRIVTNLIKFLSGLGDERFNDKSGINYSASHFDEATYHKWGARRKILYGMEQALTTAKMTSTQGISLSETKPTRIDGGAELDIPNWLFVKRDCDLDLDWGLEKLIGPYTEDGEVKGLLATYPDTDRQLVDERLAVYGTQIIDELEAGANPATFSVKVDGDAIDCSITDQGNGMGIISGDDIHRTGIIDFSTGEIIFNLREDPENKDVVCSYTFSRDWKDFYDAFETIEKFLGKNGSYAITENIIDLMDTVLVQYSFSDDEFKGMMYSLGKILSKYDGSKWVNQGEDGFNNVYRLLKNYLPFIHETVLKDDSGGNYKAMLVLLRDMMGDDGLVNFLIDEIDFGDYGSEEILDELNVFLGSWVVAGDDRKLWTTLSDLLEDLALSVERCSTPEGIREVFEDSGFQYNGR